MCFFLFNLTYLVAEVSREKAKICQGTLLFIWGGKKIKIKAVCIHHRKNADFYLIKINSFLWNNTYIIGTHTVNH